MRQNRETQALQAYMRLLERKGLPPRQCIQHEFMIVRLSRYLNGLDEANGANYRQAVDQLIRALDIAEMPVAIRIAREFFPFWMQDIKSIAAMLGEGDVALSNRNAHDVDHLFAQWFTLDQQPLHNEEQRLLAQYPPFQANEAAVARPSEDQLRIAKYLLLQLRGVHCAHSQAYRMQIDALMPLFKALGQQSLFLQVARSFYYCWRQQVDIQASPVRRQKAAPLPFTMLEALVA